MVEFFANVLATLWGMLFALRASSFAKEYAAFYKRNYSRPLAFPWLWPHFFRVGGILFMAFGVFGIVRLVLIGLRN